jgi:hypothetical protein
MRVQAARLSSLADSCEIYQKVAKSEISEINGD